MFAEPLGTAPGTTLATSLATRLRRAIVSGELVPGERLPLDQLREQFGVSLSPLREALSRLSSEGLVLIEDQKGYRVPPMSEEDQRHVTQMRSHFEIFALREAIAKGDLAWESEVTAALYILNRTDRKIRDNIETWEKAHRVFHLKLISACEMPLLLQFCSVLHDHSDRYRRVYFDLNRDDKGVPAEHKLIAEAAVTRQADLACELLRKHIERAGKNARQAVYMMARSQIKRADFSRADLTEGRKERSQHLKRRM
jgi:DNA-binding GntR family transcriptional regulator